MRAILSVKPLLAFGLVAVYSIVSTRADDVPAVIDKEKMKRWDRQFEESLGWYKLSVASKSSEPLKPQSVMRWTNATRGQKGEPTLVIWTNAGRPEALSSVYPWQTSLIYECASLAREKGLTATEDGRTIWSPARPGAVYQDVPAAPAPAETTAGRLRQAKAIAERFKVILVETKAGKEEREEMRLLPRPIHRYGPAEAKGAHPDLIDGVMFAFVQGTDPEAVMIVEAVRQGDRSAWQYAFGRATSSAVEAKLGTSVVWSVPYMWDSQDPKETAISFGRPLVD